MDEITTQVEVTLEETAAEESSAVSERKLEANRRNAAKSTGPRTTEGKAVSRFNAMTHGLLAKKIMFSAEGKLVDAGLEELVESLRDRYGRDDVRTELLVENFVADYARNSRAMEKEAEYFRRDSSTFHPQGFVPLFDRYITATRRSLLRLLKMLDAPQPVRREGSEGDGD